MTQADGPTMYHRDGQVPLEATDRAIGSAADKAEDVPAPQGLDRSTLACDGSIIAAKDAMTSDEGDLATTALVSTTVAGVQSLAMAVPTPTEVSSGSVLEPAIRPLSLEEQVAAAAPSPVIGRRRRRRQQVEARAAAHAGRRRVLHATTLVHSIAARLHAAGLMSDAALLALRGLLKRGAHRQRLTPLGLDELEREFRVRAEEMASLLPDPALAFEAAHRLADERCEEVDRRKAAQSARRTSRGHMRLARAQMRAEGQIVLAALTDEQVDVVQKRQRVLHAMDRGASWAVACTEAGVIASKAAVYRWRKAFKTSGIEGLVDRRVLNGREGVSLEIRTLARAAWRQCANGKSGSVYAVLKSRCEAAGVTAPSYGWLTDFIRYELPEDEKIVRDQGMVEWRRQAAPRHTIERASFANGLWQCDDTPLDIWVRSPRTDGSWEVLQPYATAIIDVHSRACIAVSVWTRTPNAWSVALTLRKAILPKSSSYAPFRGAPQRFAMDNGKNYRSDALGRTLALLNIRAEHCAPRSPNQKPEVERFLRTLQENLLPRFPGYKKAHMVSVEAATKQVLSLLTIEQLRDEIDRWIDVYNDSHHEGISKSLDFSPRQLWEHTVRPRAVEPEILNRLLLQSTTRVVHSKGVKLKLRGGESAEFWSPALTDKFGLKVLLLYNPEDLASVLVADEATGLPICEAFRMGISGARYGDADIVQAQQGRASELAGVADRLQAYHEEAERGDRLSPARTREVRAWIDEQNITTEEPSPTGLATQAPLRALTSGSPAPVPGGTTGDRPSKDVGNTAEDAKAAASVRTSKTRSRTAPRVDDAAASAAAEENDLLQQLIRLQGGR